MGTSNSALKTKTSAIAIFYVVAVLCRFTTNYLWKITSDNPVVSICYQLLTGIGPALGAIVVVIVFHRKMSCSIGGRSLLKNLLSLLIPVVLLVFFDRQNGFKASLVFTACITYAFLEEVGWRGYLTGEFSQLNQFKRVLVVTLFWFFWHLEFPQSWGILSFFGILLLASWGLDQVVHDSRSLIFCACLHGIFNLFKHGNGLLENGTTVCILAASVVIWFIIWYVPFQKIKSKLMRTEKEPTV